MMKTDIEIAQGIELKPIKEIIKNTSIKEKYIEYKNEFVAKVSIKALEEKENKDGHLILFTSINPTPSGEGKTTMAISLAQGLKKLGEDVMLALREPSMGPVFGIKGGATGGGYSQVLPMEDINLHLTGDLHAITACNNLISACLDNHIFQGNELDIDINRVVWKRCLDVNDRALRDIEITIDPKKNIKRKDSFNITAASEVMAILCLSSSLEDFKKRIGRCIVAYNSKNEAITVKDLGIEGSCALLMKDAINPNFVQSIEGVPTLIHGGPFANIAHGCNSILATKLAMKYSKYAVTEAGFGADLGAEKFLDIKCRMASLKPSLVCVVVTAKALKLHGESLNYKENDLEALKKGIKNLEKHLENIKQYKLPCMVCINKFLNDYDDELSYIELWCKEHGYEYAFDQGFAYGGEGSIEFAKKVVECVNKNNNFEYIYSLDKSIKEKIEIVTSKIYGAKEVVFTEKALKDLEDIERLKLNNLPICIAKTQSSLSDNPKLVGRPENFVMTVREIRISAGAGFVVPIMGTMMTMPGLPKVPAANNINIDEKGIITGLF